MRLVIGLVIAFVIAFVIGFAGNEGWVSSTPGPSRCSTRADEIGDSRPSRSAAREPAGYSRSRQPSRCVLV